MVSNLEQRHLIVIVIVIVLFLNMHLEISADHLCGRNCGLFPGFL